MLGLGEESVSKFIFSMTLPTFFINSALDVYVTICNVAPLQTHDFTGA